LRQRNPIFYARSKQASFVCPLAEDEHGKNRKANFWRRNCSREFRNTSIGGAQEQAIHSSDWICCRKPSRKRRPHPGIAFGLRSSGAAARRLDVGERHIHAAGHERLKIAAVETYAEPHFAGRKSLL
jgi:hypothetical protein